MLLYYFIQLLEMQQLGHQLPLLVATRLAMEMQKNMAGYMFL